MANGLSLMKSRSPWRVTVLTWRICRLATSSSSGRMRSPLWPNAGVGGTLAAWRLGARQAGELVGVVEGRKQRAAHQEDRGQAGENRAGEPAPVDRAPNRRLVGLLADGQRRLDAEIDGQTVGTGHSRAKASWPSHDRPVLPESARWPSPSP